MHSLRRLRRGRRLGASAPRERAGGDVHRLLDKEQKQVTRLRTADELAAVLGLTAASLTCGLGGGFVEARQAETLAAEATAAAAVQTAAKVKDGVKHAA